MDNAKMIIPYFRFTLKNQILKKKVYFLKKLVRMIA